MFQVLKNICAPGYGTHMFHPSGDGGNRTRVRKIRAPNVYERSLLFGLAKWTTKDKRTIWLSAKAQEPFLGTFSGILCRTLALRRPCSLQPELGARGRDPIRGQFCLILTMQPAEEQNSLCFWHLCCVLILRVRHLSARSLGSASHVETDHPLCKE